MRNQWTLLAILVLAAPANAAEPAGRADVPNAVADAKASARGMDFDVYIWLRKGMSEGELLQHAGPPDHQAVDGSVGHMEVVRGRESDPVSANSTESIVKTFYYFPTAPNPFTTIVSMTGGQISDLKRERKF